MPHFLRRIFNPPSNPFRSTPCLPTTTTTPTTTTNTTPNTPPHKEKPPLPLPRVLLRAPSQNTPYTPSPHQKQQQEAEEQTALRSATANWSLYDDNASEEAWYPILAAEGERDGGVQPRARRRLSKKRRGVGGGV